MIELNCEEVQLVSGGSESDDTVETPQFPPPGYPSTDPDFTITSPYPGSSKIKL